MEFDFRLDTQLTDSKAESHLRKSTTSSASSSQTKSLRELPIPDFKAMHAAHDAQMASRRVRVEPVVPRPMEFYSDLRAQERRRFEDRIREKERDAQLAQELKRKEREAQEAKEIMELRKKSVPKAHEVPDWYKDVPQRKGAQCQAIGRKGTENAA